MKKRFICFLIAAIMLLVASTAFVIGCSPDGEQVDYSVTVLDPDGEPVNGVTVTWQQDGESKGSAVTGEDGKATVSLPASTYTIVLDVDPSLSYTSVSVGTTLRSPTLELTYTKVTYQATVTDKNGAPAEGVTVSWMDGTTLAGDARTNAEGVASCELNYGDYTVTIADLPEGNIYNGDAQTVTDANSSARFELIGGNTVSYSVTVTSEGGLLFKRFRMLVYKGETPVTSGWTDENGVYTVSLAPDDYTIRAAALDNGYTTQAVSLTSTTTTAQMVLRSTVIASEPANDARYVMGSIIHDYTFTTPYEVNGSRITLQISELLKTKKAILINNWGTNCTYCVQEMPAMDEAYELYKDDIEMIAVSNYMGGDSDSVITRHYQQYGYSFPMVRDTAGLATKFGLTAWPTTVVIDRYGAVARIESGAILDKEIWGRLINKFIGDDYVQTFTPGESTSDSITTEVAKPDITVPENHYEVMAELLNNTEQFPSGADVEYYGETKYEYAWPYIYDTVEDISPNDRVVYAGGTGKANSVSMLYATVTIGAGKVFTFDYYSDTEQGSDVLSVLWDGKVVKEISGYSNGWQTCRLYADLAAGAHTLAFVYIKDSSGNADADNVFIRNVRFTELNELTEPTNMLRAAAYGVPEENAKVFPYYASVALSQEDGYYHVARAQLQNSAAAGNDDSPMLFVNLLNNTNWSKNSVRDIVYGTDPDTGNYKYDLTLTVGNVTKDYRPVLIEYLSTANNSDIYGFLPVDAELHDLLVAFTQKLSADDYHANDWLELCYFYSHYGTGDLIGNPIMGLTKKTAIPVQAGTSTADLTRLMAPFPTNIYTFTPSTSGVYRMQSLIPEDQNETYAAQIWLYDDNTDVMNPLASCGEEHVVRDGVNEHNFDLYRYLEAGHKYYLEVAFQMMQIGTYDFSITLVGNSATVLTPASYQFYWQVLDDKGNFTGAVELAGTVSYKKENGYYHSVNPDGTTGGYIYLDVKYALNVLGERSLTTVVDMYVKDPATYENLTYKMFDFRKRVAFYNQTDSEGNDVINYDPNFDMTGQGAKYIDYTARVKEIIASAPESGDEAGLVPVTQEIVDILTLYIEMRNNALMDNQYELALENEWLRFCWCYRIYNQNNA